MTDTQPQKRGSIRYSTLIPALIVMLLAGITWLPQAGSAVQNSPVVDELKQKAQRAFSEGRYAEAADIDVQIADEHPDSQARRYAVQMLGTLYENNLVDVKKAIKWDLEFLEKYADSRQAPAYKEKLAYLEKLSNQEQAYKTYQAIRLAQDGDKIKANKFEAFLKDNPDFLLKTEVEKELAYAYSRLDLRRQTYLAFQALSRDSKSKLSPSDLDAYDTSRRYLEMSTTWAWVAWGVVAMLWAAALLMKPWGRLTTRSSIRAFLTWTVLWVLFAAIRMPSFYAINTEADLIILTAREVYIAAGLNLTVLFWLLLLTRGEFWQTRPLALRWLSPVLTLAMTVSVFYLFIIYQPHGPETTDVFAVKYEYLIGEMRKRLHPATGQESRKPAVTVAKTKMENK